MHNYYCKNCNNIVGEWDNKYECYFGLSYCEEIQSKNDESIYFLDCKNCNKFVGIYCWKVCERCFGKNQLFGEKNIFNWFLKYKKINQKYLNNCKICNKQKDFRWQYWYFKELTFHK